MARTPIPRSTTSCAGNWDFSPQGATQQTEDHRVELNDVTVLELPIVPDISGGTALASTAQWRLA